MKYTLLRPSPIETLWTNISFLTGAIKNLGLISGWKYWQAYRLCQKHPEKLVCWAKACREEATRIKTSNPALATSLEANADHLHRTALRLMQICAWESTQMENTDPEYATQLSSIEEKLRKETNSYCGALTN